MEKKIRINVTVDSDKLQKAKTKLGLFGGKLSTLFNAYLSEFVEAMEKEPYGNRKELGIKLKEMENRIKRLENAKA
jgi:hypothetical protein